MQSNSEMVMYNRYTIGNISPMIKSLAWSWFVSKYLLSNYKRALQEIPPRNRRTLLSSKKLLVGPMRLVSSLSICRLFSNVPARGLCLLWSGETYSLYDGNALPLYHSACAQIIYSISLALYIKMSSRTTF